MDKNCDNSNKDGDITSNVNGRQVFVSQLSWRRFFNNIRFSVDSFRFLKCSKMHHSSLE